MCGTRVGSVSCAGRDLLLLVVWPRAVLKNRAGAERVVEGEGEGELELDHAEPERLVTGVMSRDKQLLLLLELLLESETEVAPSETTRPRGRTSLLKRRTVCRDRSVRCRFGAYLFRSDRFVAVYAVAPRTHSVASIGLLERSLLPWRPIRIIHQLYSHDHRSRCCS